VKRTRLLLVLSQCPLKIARTYLQQLRPEYANQILKCGYQKLPNDAFGSQAKIIAETLRPTGMRIETVTRRRPRGDALSTKLKVLARILLLENFRSSKIHVTAVTSASAEICRPRFTLENLRYRPKPADRRLR